MKIDKRIVKYRVRKPDEKPADAKTSALSNDPDVFRDKNGKTAKVIRMHEKLERPEVLIGSTYKIKTPVSDHAMYVPSKPTLSPSLIFPKAPSSAPNAPPPP